MIPLLDRSLLLAAAALPLAGGAAAQGSSLRFSASEPMAYEFADQRVLPPGFGRGEFTLELWLLPDTSFRVGRTDRGTFDQLKNWTDEDPKPNSPGYWYAGNWLLDGFSRPDGFEGNNTRAGSFSLQLYGGGRLRWLFADEDSMPARRVWAVQAYPAKEAPTLLDGRWHHVALVRRWREEGGARLEMWIDGARTATTDIPGRVDMRRYWDRVPHPRNPAHLSGWNWGSEVMTARGEVFTQYEDYKGLVDELRFWDRARSEEELRERWSHSVTGSETGLVGWFPFDEGSGAVARDRMDRSRVITLRPRSAKMWSRVSAPVESPARRPGG